ncbi:MAG: efflux RND transporter permease subunit [Oceanococcaceae bacterium]
MNILHFATHRPVAVSMLTLAVLLFGWVSQSRLSVTLLPDLSYPTATVRTEYAGAAPAEIETLISKPVEEALGLVRGVRRVQSVSKAGQSDVTLEFDWGTQMDLAVLDIREKLDPLELPEEAARPIVLRVDPSSDPVLRYGLSLSADAQSEDPALALKRLRRVAEDSLQKPLEAIAGVAAVKVSGGLEEEVQIALDQAQLDRLQISPDLVIRRLQEENVNLSGGRVDEGTLAYLVRTRNQFRSLGDMQQLILRDVDGRQILLRDVAEVRHGHKERTAIIRIDGREAVELAIFREGDGNTVAVAKAVNARLEHLRKGLPEELQLSPLYDQSQFIEDAISGVLQAGVLGGLLAVLVLYLFLADAWATLVIAIAIPVSIIASFVLMYASGLSLNIMSLGGLALAIGLLIDSAIVVLESIARRLQQGEERQAAAQTGTRLVALAITASTLTTIAVFFPMVFVEGIAGQLFADQALVVSGTLLISLIVALTLIPMLASRQREPAPLRPATPIQGEHLARRSLSGLRYHLLETLPSLLLRIPVGLFRLGAWLLGHSLRPLAQAFQAAYGRLEKAYLPRLRWALEHRAAVLGIALLLFLGSLALLPRLGAELLPPLSQGEFRADLSLDTGTPLERTDTRIQALQTALQGSPGLRTSYAVSGTGNRLDTDPDSGGENTAVLNLVLQSPDAATEAEVMRQLRSTLATEAGVQYRLSRPTLFSFKTPLEVELAGHDLEGLRLYGRQLENRLRADPAFSDVESSLAAGQPEVQIRFDQARVAELGLEVPALAQRVVQAMQGKVATRYRLLDREIDVLVRAAPDQRSSVQDLRELVINPEAEAPLSLQAVADIRLGTGPSEIRRIDHQRVVVIAADLRSGSLSDGVTRLQGILDGTPLPPGISASITGQSEEMQHSFASLQFALGLAVFLVYLVMASQFESLRQPFIILLTIPLAAIGAIGGLFLTGTIINVVVLIGLIVLAGIVVNNAIVLIDRINQLRAEGALVAQAIPAAAAERLRPILMTSLTTILGMLPMALASGQGAELRAPLAITIIGGLLVATLLTLIVIPVVYSLFESDPPAPAADDAPAEG